jgi:predicted DNA-binding protein
MQDFIENLIKNVEALTEIRCGDSKELSAKIREIELIEEQRKLIGSVLGQFN